MAERAAAVAPDRLLIVDDDAFAASCARWIADAMAETLRKRPHCAIALTGGSTAGPVYEALAATPLRDLVDWRRVHMYWGDERCVQPDHEYSNYRLARETLLRRVPLPAAQIHRMTCETDPDRAAHDYAAILPERLDVLLLGMGGDGHTCSLFPGAEAVAEATKRVLLVYGGTPEVHRLTITPPVIAAAARSVMMVAGASKAVTVRAVLEGPVAPMALPAQLALHAAWILDRAAASRLTRRVE